MNYHELKKLDKEFFEWGSCRLKCPMTGKDYIAWVDRRKEAGPALARHCVDNFDKALELLNKCYEILYSEYPEHDPRHPSQWGLDTGIAELEVVEP
jgi:hypothetical protein